MEDEPWVLCWTKVGQLVLDPFRRKLGESLGIKEPDIVVYMVYIQLPRPGVYRVEESPLFQRLFDVQLPPQILFASQTLLAQPHVQNDLAAEF